MTTLQECWIETNSEWPEDYKVRLTPSMRFGEIRFIAYSEHMRQMHRAGECGHGDLVMEIEQLKKDLAIERSNRG